MDKQELEITAELAELALSDVEIAQFSQAVQQILDYFMIMDKIEGEENFSPMDNSNNSLREDRTEQSSMADSILEQAPEREDRFIVIPNVL